MAAVATGYLHDMAGARDANVARGATTLGAVLEAASRDGVGDEFDIVVRHDDPTTAALRCGACDSASTPARVERRWRWRLEGASDPDDELDVSALRCPACGSLGILVTAFGRNLSAAEAAVTRALPPPTSEPPVGPTTRHPA